MRALSLSIAKCQGELADLGSVVEKRRFSAVTDIKEAKVHFSFYTLEYTNTADSYALHVPQTHT